MGEEKREKGNRSRRIYVLWGAALSLLLAAGLFSWLVVLPVARTREAVARVEASGNNWLTAVREEIDLLGGPEAAAWKLGIYVRLPLRWAPHRLSTAMMLGECGRVAFPHLIALLDDRSPDNGLQSVRGAAAYYLGEIGDKRAAEPLIALLGDKSESVRTETAKALRRLNDTRARDPLAAALKAERVDFVRREMALSLGHLGDARALPLLKKTLETEECPRCALEIPHAIAPIDNPEAVEVLTTTLKSHLAFVVRRAAAWALGDVTDKRATTLLCAALSDRYWDVRRAAAEALGTRADPRAEAALRAAAGDMKNHEVIRTSARDALAKINAAEKGEK